MYRLSPGMAELVKKLKARNVDVYLVSGGFRQMINVRCSVFTISLMSLLVVIFDYKHLLMDEPLSPITAANSILKCDRLNSFYVLSSCFPFKIFITTFLFWSLLHRSLKFHSKTSLPINCFLETQESFWGSMKMSLLQGVEGNPWQFNGYGRFVWLPSLYNVLFYL